MKEGSKSKRETDENNEREEKESVYITLTVDRPSSLV
jgi:hypothetical protein